MDGDASTKIPVSLRILAIILRALFISALVAITVRVSTPQSETLWSVHETPADLVRLALGLAVCLWVATCSCFPGRSRDIRGGSTSAL
jgi:hypothetical protein